MLDYGQLRFTSHFVLTRVSRRFKLWHSHAAESSIFVDKEKSDDKKVRDGQYIAPAKWLLHKILFALGIISLFAPIFLAVYIIVSLRNIVNTPAGAYVVAFWGSVPMVIAYVAYVLLKEQLTVKIDDLLSDVSILTIRYFQQTFIKSCIGLVVINLFAFLGWLFYRDATIFWIPMIYSILCFGYCASLFWRVKRGFFGSNKAEAQELIEYLFEVNTRSNTPPGIRRLHPALAIAKAKATLPSIDKAKIGGLNG